MKEMQSRFKWITVRPRMAPAHALCGLIAAILSILVLNGCNKAPEPSTPQTTSQDKPKSGEINEELKAALREAGDGKLKVRQVIFLNRLKKQETDSPTIDRATITEKNELGLILNANVTEDKIPDLMKSVLEKMAQEFPEDDITVSVFTQSDPPRKVGKATRNAKTKETAYTPETN